MGFNNNLGNEFLTVFSEQNIPENPGMIIIDYAYSLQPLIDSGLIFITTL